MENFIEEFIGSDKAFSVHHTRENVPQNNHFLLHSHKTYEVFYLIEGNVGYYIEGNLYWLDPGDILIINPAEMHRLKVQESKPYERIVLELSADIFDFFREKTVDLFACFNNRNPGERNLFPAALAGQRQITDRIGQILAYCKEGGAENELLSKCEIIKLMIALNRSYGAAYSSRASASEPHPKVKALVDYIGNHLTGDLAIDTLSRQFDLSKSHLCKIFKKHTGFTVNNYIVMKRILHADNYIKSGHDTTTACYASGFNDYSNFYRTYRGIMGYSPKEGKRG